MGTPFEEVYCQNYVIKSDKRLSKLSPPNLSALNWKYLQYSISLFLKDCYPAKGQTEPKVGRYIPFSQICYDYIADGIETNFHLTSPKIQDSVFYITSTVNDIVTVITASEYSYDVVSNNIIFNTAPQNLSEISISNWFSGTFLDDLEEMETTILSVGMQIPYMLEAEGRQSLLTQAVYSNTFKLHSQAEMIKQVGIVVQNQINYHDRLVMNYSYRYNQNNYTGLRGNS